LFFLNEIFFIDMYKIHINNEFKNKKIPFDDFPELDIIYISSAISLCPNKFGHKDLICAWEGDVCVNFKINGELISIKSTDSKNNIVQKVDNYEFQGTGYTVRNRSIEEIYLYFSIKRTTDYEEFGCLNCENLNNNFVRFDGKEFKCELCCMDLDKKGGSRGGSRGIRGGVRRGGGAYPSGGRRGGGFPGRTTRIGPRGANWRHQGTMGYYNRYRYHTGFALRYPWFSAYYSFPYWHPFWYLVAQYPIESPFWDTFQYYEPNDAYWDTV
jgi:hypothetical protein